MCIQSEDTVCDMAKKCLEDRNPLSCSVCLDVLQDPVTIPCGHNYCMDCIKDYWDKHGGEETGYSCPQCRKTFTPRPDLNKNTMFAEVVERFRKTRLQDSSPTHFDGPGPSECNIHTGQKQNTLKFCPERENLCSKTNQNHRYNDHTREKHTVIVVSTEPRGNICSRHNRLLGVYCRTDQQFICSLCLQDVHKGHEAFSMVPKKTEGTSEHKTPLAKQGHGSKIKTPGHGKRKSGKRIHSTGHRHGHSSGHSRVSHDKSGHETTQQKHCGHGTHGNSHGAGRRRSRDGGHGDWNTGHGPDRNGH